MNDMTRQQDDFCWRRTGVWSKSGERCGKLAEVVHCRNCDVFTQASRGLLDQPPPENYLDEWAALLEKEKEVRAKGIESVLIFRVGAEWFALKAKTIEQVVGQQDVHRIPHVSNDVMLGVANIGGDLLPCFSLHALLEIDSVAEKKRETGIQLNPKRMLVLKKPGGLWAFSADEVRGVYCYTKEDTTNIPPTVKMATRSFVRQAFRNEGDTVGCIDDDLLLHALQRRS